MRLRKSHLLVVGLLLSTVAAKLPAEPDPGCVDDPSALPGMRCAHHAHARDPSRVERNGLEPHFGRFSAVFRPKTLSCPLTLGFLLQLWSIWGLFWREVGKIVAAGTAWLCGY